MRGKVIQALSLAFDWSPARSMKTLTFGIEKT
jgi:hypothetical protein